ncbi:MAG TPA: 2OG-Fe(II) oxygenase [Gemmataceae bacterium]|nr:2OG-Fe(II) oxygenase [Gemmataceae bacterium]
MEGLDLAAFRDTPLTREPFPFLIVPQFIKSAARAAINADYPVIDSPGSFPVSGLSYGPGFQKLLDQLRGPAFRAACEEKFAVDLGGRACMITVRGRCGTRDGNIHTDAVTKIITVLIYMNPTWEQTGGCLRLLRSPRDLDDVIVEIPPVEGTLLAFRRSDNSWHGHKPFIGPRRVIQFNWVTTQGVERREVFRHRVSAWMKKTLGLFRRSA